MKVVAGHYAMAFVYFYEDKNLVVLVLAITVFYFGKLKENVLFLFVKIMFFWINSFYFDNLFFLVLTVLDILSSVY